MSIDYDETITRLGGRQFHTRRIMGAKGWETTEDKLISDAITLLQHYREGLEQIASCDTRPHAAGDVARKTLEGPK